MFKGDKYTTEIFSLDILIVVNLKVLNNAFKILAEWCRAGAERLRSRGN